MLIKKKLLQIEPQPCPKGVKVKRAAGYEKEVLIAAVQVVDGIVAVDGYTEKGRLAKRFFADGKNWQYYDPENETWSQTQDGGYFDRQRYAVKDPVPEEAAKILGAYKMRIQANDLSMMIAEYTERIASSRRRQYKENMYRNINRMLEESELPFREELKMDRWLLKEILPAISMMDPKGKNKKNRIRCMSCGCRRQVTGYRHKQKWDCPKCGRWTTVYEKRYITSRKDKEDIAYATQVPGGFAVTAGKIRRSFDEEGKQIAAAEWYEVYYSGSSGTKALYCPINSWYGFKYAKYPLDGKFYLYPGNLQEVFPEGRFGQIDLAKLSGIRFNIFDLIQGNRRLAEKTFKAGLYGLVGYAAYRQGDADSFTELTGIDQNYVTEFRTNGYGTELMYTLQYMERVYRRRGTYNAEQLKILNRFRFDSIAEVWQISEQMSDLKMINYFGRQMRQHPEMSFRAILDMYTDYLEMAELLNNEGIEAIDLSTTYFRFPKDVVEAHDRMELVCAPVMEAIEEERLRRERLRRDSKIIADHMEDNDSLEERARQYKGIRQPGGNLMAVFPETVADMVNEGTALHHCVGWNPVYRERQITGEYITFFIRKKDEPAKPYFTATYKIKDGKAEFKESYGKEHKAPGKEVRAFIDAFMLNVSKQLNMEGGRP